MNFAFVISISLFALISTIVSPHTDQAMHAILAPTELAKLNFRQAKKAFTDLGIALEKPPIMQKIIMHHNPRDNKVFNSIKKLVTASNNKAVGLMKYLSKNPLFDVLNALKGSIDDQDLKLCLLLVQTNPKYLTYALRYALSIPNLEILKDIVGFLSPKYNHYALLYAVYFSKRTRNDLGLEYLKNYQLLKRRKYQAEKIMGKLKEKSSDLTQKIYQVLAKLNLDVKDLNFAFETRQYKYAKFLLNLMKIRPDETTLHALLESNAFITFDRLLEFGIKPNEKTLQILVKKRYQINFREFVKVIKSHMQTLRPHLRSLLENAADNGDKEVIKLLVEYIGVEPTEGTLALGNDY